jgi:hypothetical protein
MNSKKNDTKYTPEKVEVLNLVLLLKNQLPHPNTLPLQG